MDNLIITCQELSNFNIAFTGHWSTDAELLQAVLNRDLTKAEVTCLSLARGFGPTPVISDQECSSVWGYIFPDGNPKGEFLSFEELEFILQDLAEIERQEEENKLLEAEWDKASQRQKRVEKLFFRLGKEFPADVYLDPFSGWQYKTQVCPEGNSWLPVPWKPKWNAMDYRRAGAMGITLP